MHAAATQAATRIVNFLNAAVNKGVSAFLFFSSVCSVLSLCSPNQQKALTQRAQRKRRETRRSCDRSRKSFAETLIWDTNSAVMDVIERKILSAFDAPNAGVRAFAEFSSDAGMNDCLQQLVVRGWLRCGEAPGTFLRTEEGRLQLSAPHDVTIYSRPGCHLCEEAKKQIAPLLKSCSARLTEINIDADPDLRARYDYDVPVIFLGMRKVAKHKVDVAQFRRQLREAVSVSA